MAGNYPDYPSYRIPFDKDGSVGVGITGGGVITQFTSTEMTRLNDEDDANELNASAYNKVAILFPRLMDIDGYFMRVKDQFGWNYQVNALEKSSDTTNGLDGTWTSIVNPFAVSTDSGATSPSVNKATVPAYREEIRSLTQLGVKGLRWNINSGPGAGGPKIQTIHIFGEPAAGENTDLLALWHPTLNQRVGVAYFDWGNVPRSSSADKTFRVKNLSSTLTAVAPRVAMDVLTDASPSVPGWHTISKGSGFAAQQTIGDLGPGAISSETLTLRRTTPSNAVFGLWAMRVFAESTTWT